ncbi:MAG: fibrillarin-like rRNA/tRNA 2'-O-methyltransferase [Candidatus Thermoplasmatota archaeon]|nr:fibrillarin-like rRNA/tRNA 2'-O-methyltransferase [Candidatus Thermoplasmatota archaeon]
MKSFSERVQIQGRSLWSRNAVKGTSLRGERLKRDGRKEWRQWNPRSSKLGAALLKASNPGLLPVPGSTCLYLGSGHGTTISHLHDHLCGAKNHLEGSIVAVDISPRCIRDIIRLSNSRPGIFPVLADCRKTEHLSPFLSAKVPWLFQDVSQSNQVEMFIEACHEFLALEGTGLLSLKSASERDTEGAFQNAEKALIEAGFTLVERIDLAGWEDQHVLFHVVR